MERVIWRGERPGSLRVVASRDLGSWRNGGMRFRVEISDGVGSATIAHAPRLKEAFYKALSMYLDMANGRKS